LIKKNINILLLLTLFQKYMKKLKL